MNYITMNGYDQPSQDVQYRITSIEEEETYITSSGNSSGSRRLSINTITNGVFLPLRCWIMFQVN